MTPNRFADWDLMMHFQGGGVGHKSTQKATDFFKSDHNHLDVPQPEMILTDEKKGVDEKTIIIEAGVMLAQSNEKEGYRYQLGGDSSNEDSQENNEE